VKVEDVMTLDVKTCAPDDDLSRVVQVMRECDCGVVPVVDPGRCALGMITDRDIAIMAATRGLPLSSIRVGDAMTKDAFGCSPQDSVESAMGVMRRWRVRRLPVLDRNRRLLGILSIQDLIRKAAGGSGAHRPVLSAAEVVTTLAMISIPWEGSGPSRGSGSETTSSKPRVGSGPAAPSP